MITAEEYTNRTGLVAFTSHNRNNHTAPSLHRTLGHLIDPSITRTLCGKYRIDRMELGDVDEDLKVCGSCLHSARTHDEAVARRQR